MKNQLENPFTVVCDEAVSRKNPTGNYQLLIGRSWRQRAASQGVCGMTASARIAKALPILAK